MLGYKFRNVYMKTNDKASIYMNGESNKLYNGQVSGH